MMGFSKLTLGLLTSHEVLSDIVGDDLTIHLTPTMNFQGSEEMTLSLSTSLVQNQGKSLDGKSLTDKLDGKKTILGIGVFVALVALGVGIALAFINNDQSVTISGADGTKDVVNGEFSLDATPANCETAQYVWVGPKSTTLKDGKSTVVTDSDMNLTFKPTGSNLTVQSNSSTSAGDVKITVTVKCEDDDTRESDVTLSFRHKCDKDMCPVATHPFLTGETDAFCDTKGLKTTCTKNPQCCSEKNKGKSTDKLIGNTTCASIKNYQMDGSKISATSANGGLCDGNKQWSTSKTLDCSTTCDSAKLKSECCV